MGRRFKRTIWFGFVASMWTTALPPASADVTIDQKAAVVERKTFDPDHRPPEMPALKPGEAAVTESQFDCDADISYKIIERKSADETCTVSLRVQMVHVTLALKVLVWLPQSVPAKLAAHEEGHRRIDQRVYEEAQSELEKEARLLDGQTLRASAADCETAARQATQSAANAFCQQYLQLVAKRVGRVSDQYDKITAHGTKVIQAEEDAITQAFRCADAK
jgi:hypothetical protein